MPFSVRDNLVVKLICFVVEFLCPSRTQIKKGQEEIVKGYHAKSFKETGLKSSGGFGQAPAMCLAFC